MGRLPQETQYIAQCPPRKAYTEQQAKQLATELRAVQQQFPKAVAPQFMADYRTLRRDCDAFERK